MPYFIDRFVLVAAAVLSGPAFARSAYSRAPVFASVVPGVFRSSAPRESNFALFRNLGVKNFVSLQGGDFDEASFAKKLVVAIWQRTEMPAARQRRVAWAAEYGINLVTFPVHSMHPTEADVEALERAADFVMDPKNQPAVFGCAFGIDRSGAVQLMIRVKYEGWSFRRAYAEWQANGHYGVRLRFTGGLDQLLWKWAERYVTIPTCEGFLAMREHPARRSAASN